MVSTYSLFAAICALGFGYAGRRWPVRVGLAAAAAMMGTAAFIMIEIDSAFEAYASAALFGGGIGGVMTLLPVAWANYYGRQNFGAIRGLTLPVQVLAQASGPLLAGVLYDTNGNYATSLTTFGALGLAATLVVLFALPPRKLRPRTPVDIPAKR